MGNNQQFTNNAINLNYLPNQILPSVDVRNMVAQYASNVLYNDFKIIHDQDDQDQAEFVNALLRNDLLRLFKSMEENLSKMGWGYLYGDIGNTDPLGNPVKDIELQYVPATQVVPLWYQNRLLYGATIMRTVLFGSGAFNIQTQQIVIPGTIDTVFTSTPDTIKEIPINQIVVDTPHFYNRYNTLGIRRTNYRTPNVEPFFNKDFTFGAENYNTIQVKTLTNETHKVFTFQHLADFWNVQYYEQDINSYLHFIKEERARNATRGLGAGTSGQQNAQNNKLIAFLSQSHPEEFAQLQSNVNNSRMYQMLYNIFSAKYGFSQEDNFLEKAYIALGGNKDSVLVEKMQSTYNLVDMLNGIEKQMKLYGEGCGYNYNVDITEGSYNNVTAVQSHNQLTLQTVKAKKSLRETAINAMLLKIYSAGVNYNEEKIKKFKATVKFEIVCNAINDQYKNPNVIISAVQNQIKSRKQAIIELNPNGTNEQVEAELMEIYSDVKIMNELDASQYLDQNQNSKEQNNIGDNPDKAKPEGE